MVMEPIVEKHSYTQFARSELDVRLCAYLVRSATGDGAAFTRLVEEVEPLVRTYLARSGLTFAERQDALQDSLFAIYRHSRSYSTDRPALPWLFTIVVNSSKAYLKDRRKRQLIGELLWPSDPVSLSPEATSHHRSTLEFLEEHARTLPLIQRQVLGLCATSSLTMQEIATLLKVPEGTVKSSLHRARAELARALSCREAGGRS
jgi:RNA polymerase sigma factor (sigma-70 family)